jgi:hypothetical protein
LSLESGVVLEGESFPGIALDFELAYGALYLCIEVVHVGGGQDVAICDAVCVCVVMMGGWSFWQG